MFNKITYLLTYLWSKCLSISRATRTRDKNVGFLLFVIACILFDMLHFHNTQNIEKTFSVHVAEMTVKVATDNGSIFDKFDKLLMIFYLKFVLYQLNSSLGIATVPHYYSSSHFAHNLTTVR